MYIYFQDVPWDQYLAMDEELKLENLARAPDTQAYSNDDSEQEPDQPTEEQQRIFPDQAMESLLLIQESNLDDVKLFDLLEQALTRTQSKKTQTELNSKSVQSSLLKFFHILAFVTNMVKVTEIQYLLHTKSLC